MASMNGNESMLLKNDRLVHNLADVMSNDEYTYNVIPLDEFCEQPLDPQKGNDLQLSNINYVYPNFEIDIEQLRTEVEDMSNSSSQFKNDGSEIMQNLTSNDESITSNSGELINHSQLNHCVSIDQVDIKQSEKPADARNMECRSIFPNQQKNYEDTTLNSSCSSPQIYFLPDTFQIESKSNVNESCLVSLSFSNSAKIQMEKSIEPMVLIRSSTLRKLYSTDKHNLNMSPETSLSMNREQQALPSKVSNGFASKSADISQCNTKMIHHGETHSTNLSKICVSHKNEALKSIKTQTEDENEQHERNQAVTKDCQKIDLCKVCGDKAGAHHHYGGRSCLGCRAFFRRSVKKFQKFPGFKYFCNCLEMCGENGQLRCKPDIITRNGCKYCRYKRCRDNAGMVDKWVLSAYTATVQNEKHYEDIKVKKEERLKCKLATNKTVPTMEMEIENEIDPQIDLKFLESMSTKYKKSFLHNSELIDTMKNLMETKKQKISSEQIIKLEFFLGQEMQHIANQFAEFRKLAFDSQVTLLQNNSATFSRVIFLKFMFESVLEEKFDHDKFVSLYRISFNNSKKKPKSKSKDAWLHVRIDSAIRSMVKLVDKNRDIFQFLMPIILFSNCSLGKLSIDEDGIYGSQLHFMQQLHQYLLIQENGDKKAAAIRFGMANDLISRFREF